MNDLTKIYQTKFVIWVVVVILVSCWISRELSDETAILSRVFIIGLVGSSTLLILRPFRFFSSLGRRSGMIALLISTVVITPYSNALTTQHITNQKLATLKVSDPKAYLAKVKQTGNDAFYMRELASIDQEEHAAIVAQRAAVTEAAYASQRELEFQERMDSLQVQQPTRWLETLEQERPEKAEQVWLNRDERASELLVELRAIPASQTEENLARYAELVALFPENDRYLGKWRNYLVQQAADDWKHENCTDEQSDVIAIHVRGAVKASLKAPRTAKFPWLIESINQGNCRYSVSSYVDSENGFGAMIRTHFSVVVEVTPLGYDIVSSNIN